MPLNRTHRITFAQMRRLREKHEVEARDLARLLLAGDSIFADEITRCVFHSLVGQAFRSHRDIHRLLAFGRLPRTIWLEIGHACAARVDDHGILALARRLWRERCIDARSARAARIAAQRLPENVIPIVPPHPKEEMRCRTKPE